MRNLFRLVHEITNIEATRSIGLARSCLLINLIRFDFSIGTGGKQCSMSRLKYSASPERNAGADFTGCLRTYADAAGD